MAILGTESGRPSESTLVNTHEIDTPPDDAFIRESLAPLANVAAVSSISALSFAYALTRGRFYAISCS